MINIYILTVTDTTIYYNYLFYFFYFYSVYVEKANAVSRVIDLFCFFISMSFKSRLSHVSKADLEDLWERLTLGLVVDQKE